MGMRNAVPISGATPPAQLVACQQEAQNLRVRIIESNRGYQFVVLQR